MYDKFFTIVKILRIGNKFFTILDKSIANPSNFNQVVKIYPTLGIIIDSILKCNRDNVC